MHLPSHRNCQSTDWFRSALWVPQLQTSIVPIQYIALLVRRLLQSWFQGAFHGAEVLSTVFLLLCRTFSNAGCLHIVSHLHRTYIITTVVLTEYFNIRNERINYSCNINETNLKTPSYHIRIGHRSFFILKHTLFNKPHLQRATFLGTVFCVYFTFPFNNKASLFWFLLKFLTMSHVLCSTVYICRPTMYIMM